MNTTDTVLRPADAPARPVYAMLRRGKQYCEQLASFTRKEPRDPASLHYAATRHTFVLDPASLRYAVTSRTGGAVKARQLPQASNIARKGRVLQGEQEREHTFVCDRTVRRSKARDFPQDCLPQVWYSALIFTYS